VNKYRKGKLKRTLKRAFNGTLIQIRSVANYDIRFGLQNSFLGHNALICAHKYRININDISSSTNCAINAKGIINSYFDELLEDSHYYTSSFVRELLFLGDNCFSSFE